MQATRQEILDYLRRQGGATVRELGSLLGLTATGIRQHLTVLERDGLVAVHESRGHIGRPALVYTLTTAGSALYPSRYDELSNLLLDEIRAIAGTKGVQSVMMRVASRSAADYADRIAGADLAGRVEETTAIINERGCLAESVPGEDESYLINQYTCPFQNVAEIHSSVCALEVEFVRQLTGGDARLVSSLLRGDKCCSYRVRAHPSLA